MAPKLILLISSGSKKKDPRCLSAARASHLHKMWAEVSSLRPHFVHSVLSVSPIKWWCLRRVLWPVRRVTTLDWVLLKDSNLILDMGLLCEHVNSATSRLWDSERSQKFYYCPCYNHRSANNAMGIICKIVFSISTSSKRNFVLNLSLGCNVNGPCQTRCIEWFSSLMSDVQNDRFSRSPKWSEKSPES
jgi:hypothetical protein